MAEWMVRDLALKKALQMKNKSTLSHHNKSYVKLLPYHTSK